MDQAKIWDYFQNDQEIRDLVFNAGSRYRYLAHQIQPGQEILNIGVGRGGLEQLLSEKKMEFSCLDPSEESIRNLRSLFGLGDRARVGFSQAIPFENGSFDVVVMSEVLEHLSDEALDKTLKEVHRVLRPGGKFIGTTPANEELMANRVICPDCGKVFHRWGHVQSFSVSRLRDILSANDFEVQRAETRAFPDWQRSGLINLIKSIVRYMLGRAGNPTAIPSIFFSARRIV
jgi:SAM-dependent methyltransferase